MYSKCKIYKLQSKKVLRHLLHITDDNFFKQEYVSRSIHPYIELKASGKERLVEPPASSLKRIQRTLKKHLYYVQVPDYVFSGIKNRSYVDNAKLHVGKKYLFKLDFTGFFPSIPRNQVYNFFINKMQTAPDIAAILTNLTTVDLDIADQKNIIRINDFLQSKNITVRNHLITGSPTSQILSYLVNIDMFNDLQKFSESANIFMTIYVDDLIFSSDYKISSYYKSELRNIIKKYGYQLATNKEKYHTKNYPKKVTGVIIDKDGNLCIKNSLRKNIMQEFSKLKTDPANKECRDRLLGLVIAARQVEPNAYSSIYRYIFYRK